MDDEHYYARVMQELRESGPQPGLWAKAFAESGGVEARAKALYLKYRAEQFRQAESEAPTANEASRSSKPDEMPPSNNPLYYAFWVAVLGVAVIGFLRA